MCIGQHPFSLLRLCLYLRGHIGPFGVYIGLFCGHIWLFCLAQKFSLPWLRSQWWRCIGPLNICRALLWIYRDLLCIYRALLRIHMTPLRINMALLRIYLALLRINRALTRIHMTFLCISRALLRMYRPLHIYSRRPLYIFVRIFVITCQYAHFK